MTKSESIVIALWQLAIWVYWYALLMLLFWAVRKYLVDRRGAWAWPRFNPYQDIHKRAVK